jgi:hypothetical protein
MKIVNKADFDTPEYRSTCAAMREDQVYHRKAWEFVMIANVLDKDGMLQPGKTGLGFGVGTEPLPAYFASRGAHIVATDQPMTNSNTQNWTGSAQYLTDKLALNKRGSCHPDVFDTNVELDYVDMNFIPANYRGGEKFDFLWSSCALEHLGTLQNGLWFIARSLSLLKPGGLAVHTTEYNLSSNTDTNFVHVNCIYREQDLAALKETIDSLGCEMLPIDYTRGTHEYDRYVDGAGWQPYQREPHLNLRIDGFDATSVLLVIRKK